MKMFTKMFAVLSLLTAFAFAGEAFAAGTISYTKTSVSFGGGHKTWVYAITWVGDASTGSVPALSLPGMSGYVMKIVTDPGSPAPTANYDMVLNSPDGDDAAMGAIQNRHTTNTEAAYPVTAAGQLPAYLPGGTYSFAISNNSVASATGTIKIYMVDGL